MQLHMYDSVNAANSYAEGFNIAKDERSCPSVGPLRTNHGGNERTENERPTNDTAGSNSFVRHWRWFVSTDHGLDHFRKQFVPKVYKCCVFMFCPD
jgi:hypothetical protein